MVLFNIVICLTLNRETKTSVTDSNNIVQAVSSLSLFFFFLFLFKQNLKREDQLVNKNC